MIISAITSLILCATGAALNENASFETLDGQAPAGWHAPDSGGVHWTMDKAGARTGDWQMALSGAGAESNEWVYLYSDSFPVSTGDCVDFRAWVRSRGGPRNPLYVYAAGFLNGTWQPLPPMAQSAESKAWQADQWFSRGYSVFVPPGVEQVRLELRAAAGESPDATWFVDDFSCTVTSFKSYTEANSGKERLKDIYLVGVDTLAQSRLGCYGAANVPTPNIDRMASEGMLYEQVTAAAPWTKPSFASIQTGLHPSQHHVENVDSVLAGDIATLAESLKARGYFTAAFVFSAYDGFLGPEMGMAQGFDVYFHSRLDEDNVTSAIQAFLETNAEALEVMNGGGLFLFHHIWEPHTPYVNRDPEKLPNEGVLGTVDVDDTFLELVSAEDTTATDSDQRYVRKVYDTEVAQTDVIVGMVLNRLRRAGLDEELNFMLCADHGEAFGERPGIWGHCHPYETVVRVPLIMRFPGLTPVSSRDTSTLVSHLDIVPTLTALAGAKTPPGLAGRDLLNPDHDAVTARLGFSEDLRYGSLTVRNKRYKLVVTDASVQAVPDEPYSQVWNIRQGDGAAGYALYDLAADPHELNDIQTRQPDTFSLLKSILFEHFDRMGIAEQASEERPKVRLSPETERMLEALGYLGADSNDASIEHE